MTASRAAFTRNDPDSRRLDLISACAHALAEHGAKGVSVRNVCAAAGVSPGLLRHYFSGIDDLVAATYVHVGEHVSAALADAVAHAGDDPRARLEAFVTASFRPPIADPELLATWLAFWSLVKTDPGIARLHREIYAMSRATLEQLLAECGVAPGALRLSAIAITALVDGLWLERSLDPSTFTPEEAGVIAGRWLETLLP